MSGQVSFEMKNMAVELHDKINTLVKPVYVPPDSSVAEFEAPTEVKIGYAKDTDTPEHETAGVREKIVSEVFKTIYDDILSTNATHIFWSIPTEWVWSNTAAWTEIHLRARYTLFKPKENNR